MAICESDDVLPLPYLACPNGARRHKQSSRLATVRMAFDFSYLRDGLAIREIFSLSFQSDACGLVSFGAACLGPGPVGGLAARYLAVSFWAWRRRPSDRHAAAPTLSFALFPSVHRQTETSRPGSIRAFTLFFVTSRQCAVPIFYSIVCNLSLSFI